MTALDMTAIAISQRFAEGPLGSGGLICFYPSTTRATFTESQVPDFLSLDFRTAKCQNGDRPRPRRIDEARQAFLGGVVIVLLIPPVGGWDAPRSR
jgi:hypothetical protein